MKMFNIVKPDINYDFMAHRRLWVLISMVLLIASIWGIASKGLNYGIDFTGGADVKVKVPQTWDTGKIREALETGGLDNLKIIQIGNPVESEYSIRAQDEGKDLNQTVATISESLGKQLQTGEYIIKSADIVGPSAGSLLRKNGFLAMFYVLLAILLYVGVRFDFSYAPGAVLALVHDAIIVLGVFVYTQKEFDLTVLAAILALIGYSNNDTIIVFDRIRETLRGGSGRKIEDTVNESINQTLGRTIMTTLSTFISVFALWMWGGSVLEPFAFALLVGLIVGSYSSIFVASSMVVMLTHYLEKKQKSGRNKKRREVKLSPEAHIGI